MGVESDECVGPSLMRIIWLLHCFFFFQAEDGIRYLVRSRGLGDVYKRQTAGAGLEAVLVGDARRRAGSAIAGGGDRGESEDLSLIHI